MRIPQRVLDNEKLFFEKYGSDLSAQQHHLIRDVESCYLSSSLAVSLAKKYDANLHVFHLTQLKKWSYLLWSGRWKKDNC